MADGWLLRSLMQALQVRACHKRRKRHADSCIPPEVPFSLAHINLKASHDGEGKRQQGLALPHGR